MISGNIVVLGENHCYSAKERTRILSSILVTSVLLLTPNIFLFAQGDKVTFSGDPDCYVLHATSDNTRVLHNGSIAFTPKASPLSRIPVFDKYLTFNVNGWTLSQEASTPDTLRWVHPSGAWNGLVTWFRN